MGCRKDVNVSTPGYFAVGVGMTSDEVKRRKRKRKQRNKRSRIGIKHERGENKKKQE